MRALPSLLVAGCTFAVAGAPSTANARSDAGGEVAYALVRAFAYSYWYVSDRIAFDGNLAYATVSTSIASDRGRVPVRVAPTTAGVSIDARSYLGATLFIPTLGATIAGGVGDTRTSQSFAETSGARAQFDVPSASAIYVAVLLPGIGARQELGADWSVSALVRPGYAAMYYGATESSLLGDHDLRGKLASWTLTTELEACAKSGGAVNLCAYVAPKLYEFGWLTGLNFGLRIAYEKPR